MLVMDGSTPLGNLINRGGPKAGEVRWGVIGRKIADMHDTGKRADKRKNRRYPERQVIMHVVSIESERGRLGTILI